MTMCLTDGRDLLVHADRRGAPLWLGELAPPYTRVAVGDSDLEVDLTKRGAKSRKGVLVCTEELGGDPCGAVKWRQLAPGQLLIVREGAVIAERSTGGGAASPPSPRLPAKADVRTYDVVHRTVYRYTKPIERSQHVFRLTPYHDRTQNVLAHELSI